MKMVEKDKISFGDKYMHISNSQRGWAIVIMPDDIRVDNHNLPTHIHIKNKGIHIPTIYQDMEEVKLIIRCHIHRNRGINLNLLKKELIGDY